MSNVTMVHPDPGLAGREISVLPSQVEPHRTVGWRVKGEAVEPPTVPETADPTTNNPPESRRGTTTKGK